MADHQKFDKMAVTSDNLSANTNVHDNMSKVENEQRPLGAQKPLDGTQKKKTFKITSVTKSRNQRSTLPVEPQNDADVDSNDDLDETVESHTEDISSEILDSSKYEIGDQDTPLDEITPHQIFSQESEVTLAKDAVVTKEKGDVHTTRFKVVKIETQEPFKRGRWVCCDSLNTPNADKSDSKIVAEEQGNSGNSSASSSVHFVPGIDDPSKNPLLSTVSQNQNQVGSIQSDAGYVSQGDGQTQDKFNQMTHNTQAHIPNSLPTHPGQNYQGMVMNNTSNSPNQPISQGGQTPGGHMHIHGQQGQVHQGQGHQPQNTQGHKQSPMQIQNSLVENQHSAGTAHMGSAPGMSNIQGQIPIPSSDNSHSMAHNNNPEFLPQLNVQKMSQESIDRHGQDSNAQQNPNISNSQTNMNQSDKEQKFPENVPGIFMDSSAAQMLTPLSGVIASTPTREDAER